MNAYRPSSPWTGLIPAGLDRKSLFVYSQPWEPRAFPRLGEQLGHRSRQTRNINKLEQEKRVPTESRFSLLQHFLHASFAGCDCKHEKGRDAQLSVVHLARNDLAIGR